MAKDKKIIKKHIFYFALRAKEFTAQQPRGNPSKALSFAEVAEVSRDWVYSGPMGSELWRGVLWKEEVRLHLGEGGVGMGIRQQSLRYGHCLRERRMARRQNVSVREWACVKDVFAPTFSSAAQGGYSHCLEVLSCVPLGPTRRLVTHLKVSFSVVQHHLKD